MKKHWPTACNYMFKDGKPLQQSNRLPLPIPYWIHNRPAHLRQLCLLLDWASGHTMSNQHSWHWHLTISSIYYPESKSWMLMLDQWVWEWKAFIPTTHQIMSLSYRHTKLQKVAVMQIRYIRCQAWGVSCPAWARCGQQWVYQAVRRPKKLDLHWRMIPNIYTVHSPSCPL